MNIPDKHLSEIARDGFTIVPRYFTGEKLRELQAAQRRVLKTWDQVKHDPPKDRTLYGPMPTTDLALNRGMIDDGIIAFGKRYLETDDVYLRVGVIMARYPGFRGDNVVHIDNTNNSLLPPSESDRTYGQMIIWVHLEGVGEDQAPLQLIPLKHGSDLSKATKIVCPEGTVTLYSNYAWHSAGDYTREDGQRFTWAFGLGRADHPWEGFRHYTQLGYDANFQKFVASLTARERQYLRFPPPGHPYYTKQTLEALEKQYPGWNSRGEYTAG